MESTLKSDIMKDRLKHLNATAYALRKSLSKYGKNRSAFAAHRKTYATELGTISATEECTELKASIRFLGDAIEECEKFGEELMNRTVVDAVEPLLEWKKEFVVPTEKLASDWQSVWKDYVSASKGLNNAPATGEKRKKAKIKLLETRARMEHTDAVLMRSAQKLEKTRLTELRSGLETFVRAEMSYHLRCLEKLSAVAAHLHGLNIDRGTEELKLVLEGVRYKRDPDAIAGGKAPAPAPGGMVRRGSGGARPGQPPRAATAGGVRPAGK